MTLLERYTNRINEQFEKVETTQRDAIIAVGNMIAEKVKDGAAVHVFDSGHIINAELIGRGGGVFFRAAGNDPRNEFQSDGFAPQQPQRRKRQRKRLNKFSAQICQLRGKRRVEERRN